jgi:hypothetical protein
MAADPRATARVKKRKEEKLSLNKPKYKMGDNFDNTSSSSRAAAMADSSLFKPKKDNPKKPTYKSDDSFDNTSNNSRTAALDAALKKPKSSAKSITDEEMADIDRRIAAVIKARKKTDPKVEITDKEIEDIAKKATGKGVVPKVDTKGKKRGLIFGKDAKFRPFGGVIARALLGDDEKFGGERGMIDFLRNKKKAPVKKQAGGMMKNKGAVGMSKRTAPGVTGGGSPIRGGTKTVPPKTRAQSRATLSPAQRRLLDSVQGREGSKQSTSVIQDLSDKYGYAPGKRAGAKGGMGKGKRAKPRGMNMGGAVGMKPIDTTKLGALPSAATQQRGTASGLSAAQRMALLNASAGKRAPVGRSGPREEKLAAAKKAMAMRGAAGRRSGGSTPRGMNMGGAAMKSKMASKGGKMGGKMAPGYKNGGTVKKKSARGVGAAKRGFGRAMR